ncbi:MAG TPA: 2-C-methyl-D-erythritol 4-phosphate cytidylyltransferase [Bacteroidia bacterium]|jgi:2-C-methyl-D-erythritol 4-phosphate cytidylyltransferase|nr:2-C-methyl-D-erythritol 4-phosphate cytidylyltransferase [Bacteroidia bacterium]
MNTVIIVAGGSGSRMKSETPKQFALLNSKPVIVHTIEKFLQFDSSLQIIVALRTDYALEFETIQKNFKLPGLTIVNGGETRFQSVKNALEKINPDSKIVAVHDAARPLVSLQTIQNTFSAAEKSGAAIPVIEINESLREIDSLGSKAVNRKDFRIVQTPQCFKAEILMEAYKQNYVPEFTDDASVVEAGGNKIYLTQGNIENIKITYPQDLETAASLAHE